MTDYYDHGGAPADASYGDSAVIRAELTAIQNGISKKLPVISGNFGKVIAVNAGATKLEAIATTGTGAIVRSNSPALSTPTGLVKGDVGLGNVDNTSDADKPVSTAQATAINAKANKGANNDITSLSGLTTALSIAQGGTGATSQSAARAALGSTATGDALFTTASATDARTTLDVYSKAETDTAISGINVAQIQPLTAVAVGNDLVITLAATKLDFRDASLPSGDVTTVSTIADTTLTIVNGATLGSANGVATRYEVVAMDNAGVLELAAANLSGGNVTDDAKLLSTTILNTSSDSANVYYSTAARTSLPQRYVGFIALSQATAGVYASQPTQVQGAGGTLTQSVPAARAYANVTGSRAFATTYTNNNNREMDVIVTGTQANNSQTLSALVNGNTVGTISGFDGNGGQFQPCVFFTVPAGSTYRVNATGGALTNWRELA